MTLRKRCRRRRRKSTHFLCEVTDLIPGISQHFFPRRKKALTIYENEKNPTKMKVISHMMDVINRLCTNVRQKLNVKIINTNKPNPH